jgi:hypothetical protein
MAVPVVSQVKEVVFGKSAEKDALIGAVGALSGVALTPMTPQLPLGNYAKVSNVVYGIALIALGAWVKHDGIGYFLIGMGLAYFVDGLVRTFIPSAATSKSYALSAAVSAHMPSSGVARQGVLSNSFNA